MAVFPDRIVLKNSTDTEPSIKSAIGTGGTDAIVAGELVVGRESGKARVYTLDSAGAVVTVGGSNTAGATPYFISGNLAANSTADTSHTIAKPDNFKEGDLLVAIMMWRANSGTITPPSGWNLYGTYLNSVVSAGVVQNIKVYTKIATASEPSFYVFSAPSSTRNCGSVIAVAYGAIDSVVEYHKSSTGTAPINVSCSARYLSVIAHTWASALASNELASMAGSGVETLPFDTTTERRLLVGRTQESGTVSCSHSSSDTANGAGAIVINFKLLTGSGSGGTGQAYDVANDGGDFDTGLTDDTTTIFDQFPISIDAHSDVDTTTTPPTNGQVLSWNGTNWVPGAAPASNLDALTDVVITTPASAQTLRYNGTNWVNSALGWADITGKPTFATVATSGAYSDLSGRPTLATVATSGAYADLSGKPTLATVATSGAYADLTGKPTIPTAINDLSDVDTVTTAPSANQVLAWNGTNWVPANQSGGGGGGGGSTGARLSETQTASSGAATFTGLGHSGSFLKVTSSLDAWIVFYGSAASRTADASRPYNTDPATGSGVLAEFYVAAGTTVLATPGTVYTNNDTSSTEAIYAAVRSQAGANVNSQVTVVAYGNQVIATVSGGTYGTG